MEWKECQIKDVCRLINGRAYSNDEMLEHGKYKIVRVGNLSGGNSTWFYSDLELPEDKYCHNGDLLFAWACTFGPHIWKEDNTIFHYHIWKIVEDKNVVDRRFYYYYLKYATGGFLGALNGSVMVHITKASMEKMNIKIPKNLADQRRIASILSSLDRKIELNNKINADLEEMAQAIFKNWFVDFEPFKDGKFVDSELGMIPEGWKVGTLGELCNFKRGKNLLTKNAIDEGVPVVAGGLEPSCYHNVANTGAPVITVSGSGANAGFMRMYHVPVWASDCSFIDISCENFYFVYCFLKVNSKLLKHAQTGAVQPHVKPSDIHDFELVLPDKKSIYDFQDKVKPFFDKIASIQKENSRLSLLRDTLLPRLMSGEIEVPE